MISIVIAVILLLLVLLIVLPILHILVVSVNNGTDTAKGGVTFWPRDFTWANYEKVFTDKSILGAFKISVLKTLIGTTLSVFFTAMTAYALKVKTLPGRKFMTMAVAFTMLFGGGLIPYYMVLKSLHFLDTFWVYVIPGMISAWNMIMIRSFFESIPDSIEESAMIDGCSYSRTFFQIILPLSKAGLAVIALFYAVGQWNDWFTGSFYIRNQNLIPLQTLLQRMLTSALNSAKGVQALDAALLNNQAVVTSESLKMATVVVATVPILLVYPFIQKYFTTGVLIGAVKG